MNLREMRKLARLSQWELEAKSQVHQSRISLIERGLKMPNEQEKIQLAAALKCRPTDIAWPQLKENWSFKHGCAS